MSMNKVHGFLPLIQSYVGRFELRFPGQWTASTADRAETNPINMASAAFFLQSETLVLVNKRRRSYTGARTQRTLGNYRNAALKLMWFALTHGWTLPPTADEFGLYLTKLSLIRDNSGALEQARNALKLICSLNGIGGAIYDALRVLAPLEKSRREYRHVAKKSAALTAAMVEAINQVYSYERIHRPLHQQWDLRSAPQCRLHLNFWRAMMMPLSCTGTKTGAMCSTRTCASIYMAVKTFNTAAPCLTLLALRTTTLTASIFAWSRKKSSLRLGTCYLTLIAQLVSSTARAPCPTMTMLPSCGRH